MLYKANLDKTKRKDKSHSQGHVLAYLSVVYLRNNTVLKRQDTKQKWEYSPNLVYKANLTGTLKEKL